MSEITKHVFDDWWTGTYIDRLTGLLPQEVEALIDYHWRELQATAIKHSLRETKEEMVYCTCRADEVSPPALHLSDCPVYQEAQE